MNKKSPHLSSSSLFFLAPLPISMTQTKLTYLWEARYYSNVMTRSARWGAGVARRAWDADKHDAKAPGAFLQISQTYEKKKPNKKNASVWRCLLRGRRRALCTFQRWLTEFGSDAKECVFILTKPFAQGYLLKLMHIFFSNFLFLFTIYYSYWNRERVACENVFHTAALYPHLSFPLLYFESMCIPLTLFEVFVFSVCLVAAVPRVTAQCWTLSHQTRPTSPPTPTLPKLYLSWAFLVILCLVAPSPRLACDAEGEAAAALTLSCLSMCMYKMK